MLPSNSSLPWICTKRASQRPSTRKHSAGLSTPATLHILGKRSESGGASDGSETLTHLRVHHVEDIYISVGWNLESVPEKCWVVKPLKRNRACCFPPSSSVPFDTDAQIQTGQMFAHLLGNTRRPWYARLAPDTLAHSSAHLSQREARLTSNHRAIVQIWSSTNHD